MEIYRAIRNKVSQAKEEFYKQRQEQREQLRQRETEHARALIVQLHIETEGTIGDTAIGLARTRRKFPTVNPEFANRFKHVAASNMTQSLDAITERGEIAILDTLKVDDHTRKTILIESLTEARNYWDQRLQKSDLAYDEILMGRRRLTRLSSRLDSLTQGPNEQPK